MLDRLWTCRKEPGADAGDDSSFAGEEGPDAEETEPSEDECGIERERTLDEEILEIVDIIPVSMSSIMEELHRRGREVAVPVLMNRLLDMTGSGQILQSGAYYRRLAG